MGRKKIDFMCTAFRDGFQSVYGARVFTKDFLPALAAAKDAGINYFEVGGGARFQSLYFYCNEDAFDMMDSVRDTVGPDIRLQTLARGVNVVGLESQSGDIIKLHADLFAKHGINVIRNFDALNDVNNLIYSGECITKAGLEHQVCVTMMELPPGCTGSHTPEFYADTLRKILDAEIPYRSVCFKDASGTAVPSKVYETIKLARKMLPEGTNIHFHTHETAGIGVMANMAAIDAGADTIDLSLAPCSGGTAQPDIIVMWHALSGTDYFLDVDIDKIRQAEEVFKDSMKDYFLPPEAIAVEPLIPWSPMPGGALTANTQMLRDNGIMDRYPEIIKAMREVVQAGGYGTSVTPVSQFYFQQAFNNVMFGPWKKIVDSYGQMVLGYFGKTPVAPDKKVVDLAKEQLGLEPTEKTVLEINNANPEKGKANAKKILKAAGIKISDENIFIVATCKEKGIAFLKGDGPIGVRKIEKSDKSGSKGGEVALTKDGSYTVTVNGREYNMLVDGEKVIANGREYQIGVSEGKGAEIPVPAKSKNQKSEIRSQKSEVGNQKVETGVASINGIPIMAELPGKVFKIVAEEGASVKVNEIVVILEAMKMEIEVGAPQDGVVSQMMVSPGQQVGTGEILAYLQ